MGRRQPRVAVLDDDTEFAALMTVLLEEEGYRPECPLLDADADPVEILASGAYDLAILDLRGVAAGDISMLHRVRADARLAALPILVCSADIQVLRDNAATLSGMPYTAALEKPFRIEMLTGALRRLLEGAPHADPPRSSPNRSAIAEIEARLAALGQSIRWAALDAWILDVRPGFLRCVATWTAAERFDPFAAVSRRTRMPFGGGLPGRVWVSGTATWIEDVSRDLNFPRQPAARSVGLVSAAAAPVVDGGATLGVLAAYHTLRRRQDARVVDQLRAASDEAVPLFRRLVPGPAA